ncbi:UTP--glucose-1-phosphate uridylyltransferase [Rheinheimera salexigens]|nr:sugar phosphate nucleotidyltransferase [Rheinheimera salexigens]
MLEKRVKRQLLDEVQAICPKDVTIMQVRQGEAKGLGHAVLCALPVVGNSPFAVLLPDVIVDGYDCNLAKDNLAKMVKLYAKNQLSQIMVEPVPMNLVSNYGIADVDGKTLSAGASALITNIIEKPNQTEAPSNLSVVGRYVFNPAIWDCLKRTPLGAGDEIQLTDAIALLMQQQQVQAHHISGRSHDCGNKLGYIQAFVEYAMRDKILGADVKQILKNLVN